MPEVVETDRGKITISEDVIAMLASFAANENYGLVDMKGKNASESFFDKIKFIGSDSRKKGVKVTAMEDGSFSLDLYVKLMYGINMSAVAKNLMSNVRYRVEELAGIQLNRVNVHVVDVWIENSD
ncbi:MAG: Asp23/Gls24 family envelope stress response protein [Clostridiales bacterium]|jgi:uncharacterized alkaline shock family protein YloU|nr:Asp23/Gls24 family envelope stress response protein [Clostridiales bacterium]